MFMKQYNYKPRSGSQSSGTSGQGVAGSPPKGAEEQKQNAGTGGASITQQAMGGTSGGAGATAGAAGRRRVSMTLRNLRTMHSSEIHYYDQCFAYLNSLPTCAQQLLFLRIPSQATDQPNPILNPAVTLAENLMPSQIQQLLILNCSPQPLAPTSLLASPAISVTAKTRAWQIERLVGLTRSLLAVVSWVACGRISPRAPE